MLVLSRALHEEIIAHCRSAYPKEACGVLAGHAGDALGQGRIVQVYPMTNVDESPIGYSLDPTEQLAVEKQMRQRTQRMIGIYHSHTASEAYPSSVDVSLAISSDVSYVLVSLKHRNRPEFKSYRIDGTTVTSEQTLIEEAPAGRRPIATP